ncbi:MAG: GIY-YIG nuclease family protein [Verrucomicrobiales bacterium]|nr:GIY-YIG nuclease family protein [Verrucomicrobiales bacterium]
MIYQVYVIENSERRRYIGLSSDVSVRLKQHNSGESTYTKNKGPWSLVWTSRDLTLSEARKLELKMKKQKGGSGLQTLMDAYGS